MRGEVDIRDIVVEDDIVDMKTSCFRQSHASVRDKSDQPPSLIISFSTVLLYLPDVLYRDRLTLFTVVKVR